LVVVDDHSTDASDKKIRDLQKKHLFKYMRNEMNIGLNPSIVKGLQACGGAFIAFLASDDFISTNKLEEQVKYLLETGKDGVYSTGFSVQGDKKERIVINQIFNQNDKSKILKYLYQYDWGVPLQQSSLLKRNVFFDLINLRGQFKSDDWAFIIRVYELYDIGYLDKPLFFYRLHETNTHKKYWYTFPMRVDIASRLVPEEFKVKTLSNLFLSQGQYLLADKKSSAFRFFLSSLVLDFSVKKIFLITRSFGSYVKHAILNGRKHNG
jgi:glycosyltransferase involved in cell wall biosynthesis